jgi:hypothetical protein
MRPARMKRLRGFIVSKFMMLFCFGSAAFGVPPFLHEIPGGSFHIFSGNYLHP